MKSILKSLIVIIVGVSIILSATPALAQVGSAATGTPGSKMTVEQRIVKRKEKANQEINRRLASLAKLKTIIQNMKHITDTQKASLTATIDAQVASLTALKTKIAADTDLNTLKTDQKQITQSHRIYALVLPQVQILAAANRALNVSELLMALTLKLEERINKAASEGKAVTSLQTALTDMKAKIADAKVQAEAAITAVVSLTPDNGDQAKATLNRQALLDGRAKLKAARVANNAAKQQAQVIRQGLRGFGTATTTPATPPVTP